MNMCQTARRVNINATFWQFEVAEVTMVDTVLVPSFNGTPI